MTTTVWTPEGPVPKRCGPLSPFGMYSRSVSRVCGTFVLNFPSSDIYLQTETSLSQSRSPAMVASTYEVLLLIELHDAYPFFVHEPIHQPSGNKSHLTRPILVVSKVVEKYLRYGA